MLLGQCIQSIVQYSLLFFSIHVMSFHYLTFTFGIYLVYLFSSTQHLLSLYDPCNFIYSSYLLYKLQSPLPVVLSRQLFFLCSSCFVVEKTSHVNRESKTLMHSQEEEKPSNTCMWMKRFIAHVRSGGGGPSQALCQWWEEGVVDGKQEEGATATSRTITRTILYTPAIRFSNVAKGQADKGARNKFLWGRKFLRIYQESRLIDKMAEKGPNKYCTYVFLYKHHTDLCKNEEM
jgi:hypothetical protein